MDTDLIVRVTVELIILAFIICVIICFIGLILCYRHCTKHASIQSAWRILNPRAEHLLLERRIEIKASPKIVFDCICTPEIWTHCYPETIAVGGTTKHKPVKPGDIFYEKFLWGGFVYTVFEYAVDVDDEHKEEELLINKNKGYEEEKFISFTGKIISTNIFLQIFCPCVISNMRGQFQYELVKISENETLWIRKLFFKFRGKGCLTNIASRYWTALFYASQLKGSAVFVANVKKCIEANPKFLHLN